MPKHKSSVRSRVESYVNTLDAAEAASIAATQQLLREDSVREQLAFIKANLGHLPQGIERLEEREVPLAESLEVFEGIIRVLDMIPNTAGERFRNKCKFVLSRNPDYERIRSIAQVLRGDSPDSSLEGFSPSELSAFKFAPITSVDVERSFSMLKYIRDDRRHSFTFENLKMVLVIYCNQ
ncbi:uncharacterized protein LOC108864945 [Galendromus occidentalis]|uniref:Uncharacterized protein LOC108864945 n=1 Tax=Galendromus occidentalis TaxID=34638 RepID=A0AAJ7L8E3_9ACAR|nr:uncharacterized protein LOC108864945 [Galendromus occidentalis]